jgi:bifunctional ADP-heptose synthase (sugar kinase/adenylyltransferase)
MGLKTDKPRVLVIGDSCDDVFRYGVCDRLVPEAPVPVFKPMKTRLSGGMSANVAENIRALGVDCDLVTNTKKPTKTRIVDEASNQLLVRIDEDDLIEEIDKTRFLGIGFSEYDAVVVSDYNKGFLSTTHIRFITERNKLVFMDSKRRLDDWARKVRFIKINKHESDISADWLNNRYLFYRGELIVTNGPHGAVLNFKEKFPIEKEHFVRDLSGAGDIFLSALVVEYLMSGDVGRAIGFANRCASWSVAQKGIVVIDKHNI